TLFLFSSRRRHTRFSRDWSSDVCSSDLDALLHEDGLDRPAAVRPDPEFQTQELSARRDALPAFDRRRRDQNARKLLMEGLRQPRSEERRVGKGGRSGGVRDRRKTELVRL